MLLICNAQGHLKSQGKLTRTSGNLFKNLEFMFAFENTVEDTLISELPKFTEKRSRESIAMAKFTI